MSGYGSDAGNPNYIESVGSLKKKTKEDLRIDQLIPEEILTDSGDTGIKQLLENITDEDCNFIGFSNEWCRPEWLICSVLPVPPPSVRPSVKQDNSQRMEDDLTHKLFDIIKVPELIFGKGFFADQVYLQPIEKVASNSFVNILFNTGFISLLIYMAVILIFFIRYFKFKNLNHTNIYISISHYYFIYFIFRSFFEDTLAFVSIDLLLLGSASVLIKHYSQRANN